MNRIRVCDLRASALLLFAALCTCVPAPLQAQFAALVDTGARYAGNSTGTNLYSGDSGTATATSLNAPSYAVLDASGNLFVSDTANNCVRKIDTAGNLTTVAGLRVSGSPDTCNAALNSSPSPVQGLLAPTGLALDSAGTLYIADSGHNCVRTLASGAVDSFAANALTTVAGTCSATDTASATPVPNGLAVDAGGNLYISVRDAAAATPVNQVLLHASGASATAVCYLAGQSSANVPNACSGITGSATLSSPAGLAFDPIGDLFIADTGNNCVRELAGLATLQTAVGQCANDGTSGTSTSLQSPYGLAVTPANALLITQGAALENSVVSYSSASGTLTLIAGSTTGAPGAYTSALDGQSAVGTALNSPLGLTTDSLGNIYLADSGNNVVRKLTANVNFGSAALGSTTATQTVTFQIILASNLTAAIGADYSITANTCAGAQTPAGAGLAPATCQVTVAFTPTRPGARNSALRLADSLSGGTVEVALDGTGIGSLSLFTPGVASTLASGLRTPIALSVDSAGDTYLLEQGNAADNADILFYPAGGGSPTTIVAPGANIYTPTAMAVDVAGNIFVAEAATNSITRFGADGTIKTSYITNAVSVTALAVDAFDNLYIAQAGTLHNVVEVYADGPRRILTGTGTTASADGVAAASAQLLAPSGLSLSPNGIYIADTGDASGGHFVYLIDNSGIIHIVAGNGGTSTTDSTQATGTALLYPVGLSTDAAGDLYISDRAANLVYEVFPVQSSGSNISAAFGTGVAGDTGDGGAATSATLETPLGIALDGSANLYVVDFGNNAIREITYPGTRTIDFGHVVLNTTSTAVTQTIVNAGNASLTLTTPFTTTDTHFAVATADTTCTATLAIGGVCTIGYTFTPTVQGIISATSTITSNAYDSSQTVNLTGYGVTQQHLQYTLTPETEVYGYSFTQSASITVAYPDLTPSGSMVFKIAPPSGETTCTSYSPFATTINCAAQQSGLDAGTYTVDFTFNSSDSNYFTDTGTTTLTVTPAPLTVAANNVTKVYGASVPTSFSGQIAGTQYNDLFQITGGSTTATQLSPVGAYPITLTITAVGGSKLSDYTITYTGTLTIVGAPFVVNVSNLTRPYGAANPALTGSYTSALNGDQFTVTYSTTATSTSPAGTYPITATVTGSNISNYTVTVNAGTLTVTPIPLTVTANNATRDYNIPNPTFSGTVTGLINGDTVNVTYSSTALASSPAGTYPIIPTVTGAALTNYTLTANNGTLTVNPANSPLVVSVNSATRTYGAANPTFSGSTTGLLNGDTVTVTYSTTATSASPVGSYPITATVSGSAAANYTLSVVAGTLTVTQAATSVSVATSASPAYYGTSITFTATVSSAAGTPTGTVTFLNGSTTLGTATLSAGGTATFSTSSLPPGTATIAANYSGDTNFAASSANLSQVVSAGSFSLSATPASQFIRGAGTTIYTITATSAQDFAGPVALTCAGLPSDATCTFANPSLTLSAGGTATTSMTVTNTANDAKLANPDSPARKPAARFAPVVFAATLPFELTGLGILFAGTRRNRRKSARSAKLRLVLLLLCTAGLMGLAGCACVTSVYKNYTVTVTGTSTVPGVASQSTTVILSVGQQ